MWTFAFPHTLLLFLTLFLGCQGFPDRSAIRSELATLNLVCRGFDSCGANRTADSLLDYNCHCGSFCKDMDTCCLDSPFRPNWRQAPRFAAKCLPVYGRLDLHVLMVDECGRGWRDDADEGFVRDMCSSSGQDRDDPFLAVPVTSPRTGITYKNYYCAVCNENPPDGQVAFWKVEVRSKTQTLANPSQPDLKYDSTRNSWTAESDEGLSTPVSLDMKEPDSVRQKVQKCRSAGQVSECSPDWTDRSTADKCSAYMALVSSNVNRQFVRYKNPHCALCNFEEAYALDCEDSGGNNFEFSVDRKTFFVGLFILGDEEGSRGRKKCGRGQVFDGLAKKCRTVKCPRNHTLRNRKCVPDRS